MIEKKTGRQPTRPRRARGPVPTIALRRLPLASLRVFVAVGEHLSFTRAADTLGVTASAASLQIRALEEYLRTPLFRRDGRHVALTTEGAALLPKVRRGLEDLERALDGARVERGSGSLRLTTFSSFLAQWLLPRLSQFTAVHPRLNLEINSSNEAVDFVKSGMHAGIRIGVGDWPGLHIDKLFDDWLVPVCRPSLLKAMGPVKSAADLSRFHLLHSVWEPWTAWLLDEATLACVPGSSITLDDSFATMRAAESGDAIALMRWSVVAREVEDGRLAIASSRAVKHPRGYYFVCPPALLRVEQLELFRVWLLDEARKFQAAVPFLR